MMKRLLFVLLYSFSMFQGVGEYENFISEKVTQHQDQHDELAAFSFPSSPPFMTKNMEGKGNPLFEGSHHDISPKLHPRRQNPYIHGDSAGFTGIVKFHSNYLS